MANYMIGTLLWIWSWCYYIGIWINIYELGGYGPVNELLRCFTPVYIAYDFFLPSDGANGSLNPIIFIHGTCSTKETWYDIPQKVADRTKRIVYNIDASNHGDSVYYECFNYDVVAVDILQFMRERGISKVILIGHAMGAIAAMKVALANPEKVEKLIVGNARVTRITDEELQGLMKDINLFEETAAEVPIDFDYPEAYQYMNEKLKNSATLAEFTGKSERQGNATALVTITRKPDGHYALKCNLEVIATALNSTNTTMSDNIGLYENPVLFIYGSESPFKPTDFNKGVIVNRFPNARLMPIEGANRLVHVLYPEEYTDAVTQFISQYNT